MLRRDPTSHVQAALAGWEHPASREWMVLADLYDAYARVHFKKPKPYPRPWPNQAKRERFGTRIDPASLPDVMRAFGREPIQPPA